MFLIIIIDIFNQIFSYQFSRHLDDYGVEGVYCKACKDFMKNTGGKNALESANDHCTLLKHHLHVKVRIIAEMLCVQMYICDMIKGNESLVENVNFYFLITFSK